MFFRYLGGFCYEKLFDIVYLFSDPTRLAGDGVRPEMSRRKSVEYAEKEHVSYIDRCFLLIIRYL